MEPTHLVFAAAALAAYSAVYFIFGRASTVAGQMLADRRVPYIFVGLWTATAFTFSTTSFFSASTAYGHGLAGFAWYALGNTAGYALWAILVMRMTQYGNLFSLPELQQQRYGSSTSTLYTLATAGIQAFYVLPLQFTLMTKVLELTLHLDRSYTLMIATVCMSVPVILGGMYSSIVVDAMKTVTMGILIVIIAPFAIGSAPEHALAVGIASANAKGTGFFDLQLLMSEKGFPFFASLVSAGPIDQALYQRYFSSTRGPVRWVRLALIGGGVFFAIHMIAGASLGFLAAAPSLGVNVTDSSTAGYEALKSIMPAAAVLFVWTVVFAFIGTGDSSLNASSLVLTMDVYKRWCRTEANDKELIFVQRLFMFLIVIFAAAVSYLGTSLFLMVVAIGAVRSSLLVPTVVGMYVSRERVPDVFWGIIAGIVVSVALLLTGHIFLSSFAGWLITGAYCLVVALTRR